MNDFSLAHIAMELLCIDEDIRFRFKNRNTRISDFEMFDFTQVWGDTTLGFGGIGGQAMTSARTYVFVPVGCEEECFVYFAGRFAYSVPYSRTFMEDVRNGRVVAKYEVCKYMVKEKKELKEELC